MRNFLVFLGIIFVAWLAISDTISHFEEVENLSIITPAQQEMRQPARQNPGQRSVDIQTEKIRNRETNSRYDTNPNNNSNRFDNFNRNKQRTQNRLRENTNSNNLFKN